MTAFGWILFLLGIFFVYYGIRGIQKKSIKYYGFLYKGVWAVIYGASVVATGIAIIAGSYILF